MTKEDLVKAGITPTILANLALAVESGCDEATQRASFGDETVDWVNEAHAFLIFPDNRVNSAQWKQAPYKPAHYKKGGR